MRGALRDSVVAVTVVSELIPHTLARVGVKEHVVAAGGVFGMHEDIIAGGDVGIVGAGVAETGENSTEVVGERETDLLGVV